MTSTNSVHRPKKSDRQVFEISYFSQIVYLIFWAVGAGFEFLFIRAIYGTATGAFFSIATFIVLAVITVFGTTRFILEDDSLTKSFMFGLFKRRVDLNQLTYVGMYIAFIDKTIDYKLVLTDKKDRKVRIILNVFRNSWRHEAELLDTVNEYGRRCGARYNPRANREFPENGSHGAVATKAKTYAKYYFMLLIAVFLFSVIAGVVSAAIKQ